MMVSMSTNNQSPAAGPVLGFYGTKPFVLLFADFFRVALAMPGTSPGGNVFAQTNPHNGYNKASSSAVLWIRNVVDNHFGSQSTWMLDEVEVVATKEFDFCMANGLFLVLPSGEVIVSPMGYSITAAGRIAQINAPYNYTVTAVHVPPPNHPGPPGPSTPPALKPDFDDYFRFISVSISGATLASQYFDYQITAIFEGYVFQYFVDLIDGLYPSPVAAKPLNFETRVRDEFEHAVTSGLIGIRSNHGLCWVGPATPAAAAQQRLTHLNNPMSTLATGLIKMMTQPVMHHAFTPPSVDYRHPSQDIKLENQDTFIKEEKTPEIVPVLDIDCGPGRCYLCARNVTCRDHMQRCRVCVAS